MWRSPTSSSLVGAASLETDGRRSDKGSARPIKGCAKGQTRLGVHFLGLDRQPVDGRPAPNVETAKTVSESMPADPLLFVHTNIWLDFYRSQTGAGLSLLKHLEDVKDQIVMTYQVEIEFKGNRQRIISDSYNALKPLSPLNEAEFLGLRPGDKVVYWGPPILGGIPSRRYRGEFVRFQTENEVLSELLEEHTRF
jgi:PIN domain